MHSLTIVCHFQSFSNMLYMCLPITAALKVVHIHKLESNSDYPCLQIRFEKAMKHYIETVERKYLRTYLKWTGFTSNLNELYISHSNATVLFIKATKFQNLFLE